MELRWFRLNPYTPDQVTECSNRCLNHNHDWYRYLSVTDAVCDYLMYKKL